MVKIENVKKLLRSHNEEDVLIGVELLHKKLRGSKKGIREYFQEPENDVANVNIDVYIGRTNIVFSNAIGVSVYHHEADPDTNKRVVRL